jgi:WD40 repeat protein
MRVLSGHRAPVLSVAYAPDGRSLASGDADGLLLLWDLVRGDRERLLSVERDHLILPNGTRSLYGAFGAARSLKFSPDGRRLAVGMRGGIVLLRLAEEEWHDGGTLPSAGGSCSIAFSADGEFVAWTGYLDQRVCLKWDTTSRVQKYLHGYRGGVLALAHSPQAPLVACGCGLVRGELVLWSYPATREGPDPTAVVDSMRLRLSPDPNWDDLTPVYSLAFAPNGATLASGEKNGVVRLWDVEDRKQRTSFGGHGSIIKALAFTPDGRTLLSAEENGVLILWDVASGVESRRFDWSVGRVRGVAISPDGMTAAAAGSDCSVLVWDLD